jgi:nitrogen regulatory protein PII
MLKVRSDIKNLDLITCVVQRGKGDAVWAAARSAGAGGSTILFGRGMGVRERLGLLGVAIAPEKEVIMVVSFPQTTERIYQAMIKAGKIDIPGQGIIYVQRIDRCSGLVGFKKKRK